MTHENIQNLWTDITVHMLHILQQFGKDYITGTNTNRWKNYVLTHSGLQLSFYYFFFQLSIAEDCGQKQTCLFTTKLMK